jgi:hypothetical protein
MGLDTVELVMGFEEAFGIAIVDEDAARLRTPRMVLDYVAARVAVVPADGCATQRTFYALRRGLRAAGAADGPLRPGTPLRALTDRAAWPGLWTRVRAEAAEPEWPASVPWSGFWSDGPATLGQLARHVATRPPAAGQPWTREQMELALRHVVDDVTGVREFSLDDEFVRDMKLD